MPEQLPAPRRGGRHERPTSPGTLVVSVLLGVLWLVSCLAAFAIGFGVTGVSGTARPDSPPGSPQPGLGAAVVGLCCALFVFIVGAQISLVRDSRRHPLRRLRPLRSSRAYTIPEALRHNALICILVVPGIVLGLWLRHRYG